MKKKLTILMYKENNWDWVAQCLEYDIAAQAETIEDVKYEFERTLNVEIALDKKDGKIPLSEIDSYDPNKTEFKHQFEYFVEVLNENKDGWISLKWSKGL